MTDSLQPALRAEHLSKVYDEGPARIQVLDDVSLVVARGEMVAIVGASGSGKSTLLHILGLLDVPSSGSVVVDGTSADGLSESRKSALRNRSLGFVYQFH
ncbi:ATP-binding cassette domain-containing protein, partial [Bordetella hinzii]|nr:ATP-binding cassette domain-containing protein [Bordetella hinzii]